MWRSSDRTVNDDQHELVVLLRGYGSRRLPSEKSLLIIPVVVTERRELAPQSRQKVNLRERSPFIGFGWSHLQTLVSPRFDGGSVLAACFQRRVTTLAPGCRPCVAAWFESRMAIF